MSVQNGNIKDILIFIDMQACSEAQMTSEHVALDKIKRWQTCRRQLQMTTVTKGNRYSQKETVIVLNNGNH